MILSVDCEDVEVSEETYEAVFSARCEIGEVLEDLDEAVSECPSDVGAVRGLRELIQGVLDELDAMLEGGS